MQSDSQSTPGIALLDHAHLRRLGLATEAKSLPMERIACHTLRLLIPENDTRYYARC